MAQFGSATLGEILRGQMIASPGKCFYFGHISENDRYVQRGIHCAEHVFSAYPKYVVHSARECKEVGEKYVHREGILSSTQRQDKVLR